jgi:hypothetical protein
MSLALFSPRALENMIIVRELLLLLQMHAEQGTACRGRLPAGEGVGAASSRPAGCAGTAAGPGAPVGGRGFTRDGPRRPARASRLPRPSVPAGGGAARLSDGEGNGGAGEKCGGRGDGQRKERRRELRPAGRTGTTRAAVAAATGGCSGGAR